MICQVSRDTVMNPKLIVVLLVMAAIALPRVPTDAKPPEEEKVAKLDLRKQTDADGSVYYIVFCARKHNLPNLEVGHAWVLWAKEDRAKMASVLDQSYGFWPQDGKGVKSVVTVPGQLKDELLLARKSDTPLKLTHRLIVVVNKSAYDNSLKVVDKYKDKQTDYNLLKQSCKHFVHEVAREIGVATIKVDPTEWPETLLTRMIENAIENQKDKISK